MDLNKNGKLLCDLRKAKGMTQKEVADILSVVPEIVSKWETGHGFPDVSTVSALADIIGVSEKTILSGEYKKRDDIKIVTLFGFLNNIINRKLLI